MPCFFVSYFILFVFIYFVFRLGFPAEFCSLIVFVNRVTIATSPKPFDQFTESM